MAAQHRRFLVATDLAEGAREVLDYAVFLARPLEASLEVLFVWEPPRYLPATAAPGLPEWSPAWLEEASRQGAQRDLEDLVRPLQEAGVPLETRVETGIAGEVIVARAAQGFDLIVMGTHGRRGVARLFLGSVAARVVAQAPCPVVTLRPGVGYAHGAAAHAARPA